MKATLLVGGASIALFGLAFGYRYFWRSEKAVRVGVVSQLLVYPLKSGKAVPVDLADCLKIGLKSGEMRDRHWLVVTEDGRMVTGRHEPRLVLGVPNLRGGSRPFEWPQHGGAVFPSEPACKPVYRSDIQGRDCGDEVSHWLTLCLDAKKTFRLVHFEPQMKARAFMGRKAIFPQFEQMAYLDISPVMILSEASVKDLSSKLEQEVTAVRFRPNIVISECEAFSEDSWEELQIGDTRLRRIQSCARCLFITVDPETGIMSRKQPLETLKSYRMCKPAEKHLYKSSPLFGQLHLVQKTGVLHVGDVVYKISH